MDGRLASNRLLHGGLHDDQHHELLPVNDVRRAAAPVPDAPCSADEVLASLPAPLRERTSITLVDEPVYVWE